MIRYLKIERFQKFTQTEKNKFTSQAKGAHKDRIRFLNGDKCIIIKVENDEPILHPFTEKMDKINVFEGNDEAESKQKADAYINELL